MSLSAQEVKTMAEKQYPGKEFAISDTGTGIGAFMQTLGRFQTICGYCIDGVWRNLQTELLINGKHVDSYETAMKNRKGV